MAVERESSTLFTFFRRLTRTLWLVTVRPLASFVFVVFLELPLALCLFAWWSLEEKWEAAK